MSEVQPKVLMAVIVKMGSMILLVNGKKICIGCDPATDARLRDILTASDLLQTAATIGDGAMRGAVEAAISGALHSKLEAVALNPQPEPPG